MTKFSDWYTSAALLQVMQVLLAFVVPCRAMPHFTSTPYTVTVSEATPVGTTLINVTAIPGTPGNTLSYIIFNNPPIFQIDGTTGSIYLVGLLDYEQATSHVFNVEVKEQSDVVMTQVTVHVTNENDNPLTCDQTLVVASIPEGPPSPSSIPLSCVDRDEPSPGSISYQIMSGNDTGLFSIDIDGTLHIVGDLDYEQHTLHEVIVNASSGGTPSPDSTLLLTVLIVVEPRNEYSPTFENDEVMFTFNVSESAPIGTTVGTIQATDADTGVDGDLIFSTSTQDLFTLQPSTGQLLLTQSLDYEQATLYELTVTVSDSSPDTVERLSATAIVVINIDDVNEYDPIFSQEVYVVIVSEDETVGSEIITVECVDNDSDSTVSYSIESGNDENHFSIDATTGTVVLVSVVDYDPDSSLPFQLVIQCEDSGSPSRSAQSTLIISVEGHNRNLPPSLSVEDYTVYLSEDSSLGTTVVSLASIATDTNRGLAGPLQFFIDHNPDCPQDIFLITPTSGTVYLVGFLDHETSRWYVCEVSMSNRESTGSATLNIFISVTDVNDEVPLCLQTLYTLSIPEDSAVGSDLLTLSCSDADSDTLEYSIIGTSNTFELTQSGVLSLLAHVDSEALSTHNVHINVSDGLYAVQLSVFIYVEPSNEAAPTFNQTVYDCSLPEHTDIGSTICTVTATDLDSWPDGDISYSIISGNDDNIFAINSWSGEVVLAGYIDYEVIQGYVILVCASDSADLPLSSSVQVRISVLDSNDNAPIISPLISASIEENSVIGSVITELECTDVDSGSNGDVTLTINSLSSVNVDGLETEETGVFLIDSLTNEVVLDTIVDFESSILYKLSITCRDNGIQPLISSSTVLVSITPLNEFAPVLSQENYYISVSESSDIGTSILQITATDNDKGIDGIIEYSIESSEGGVNFLKISATSGNIFTQQLLNCDWGRMHDFTIIASDRGSPVLTSQSQLHITFEHCQLGQLTPRQAIYFADIMENSPTNTEVVIVGCDAERMWEEDSAPEYGILSPMESPFQINPLVGQISISTPPDYEQATSYMLQLNCTDPSSPQSYAYFSAYITILPENEHPPEFIHLIYEGEIAEDVTPGTSVLQVQANDDDSGIDGRVVFSIHESIKLFTVDSMTGVIYTLASLDRENESFYSFHVVVVDQLGEGNNMYSSMTEVQVSVSDTNDNSPLCDRVVYHVTISPLVHVGYRVLSPECTDADTDLNSELHYSLQAESHNTLELFSLNENTGDLMLAREFDASSALIHQMIITVEDNGVPSLSSVALVVVEVQSSVVMTDGETLAEVEGVRNALELTLKDMPIELWTSIAEESFQRAVAHSVTIYCALWPEACSLLSGCAHFYRNKRSSREYFYTVFSTDNVVILPNSTLTFTSIDGTTNLNFTFYVTLPEGVRRSDYRTTDYVIPGSTLSIMLQDEQPVIEAQVRDNITSSLRAQKLSGVNSNMNWVWAVITSIVVVLSCVFVAIAIALCTFKWIFHNTKKKGGARIVPLNMTSGECTNTSEANIPSGARIKKKLLQKNGKRLITLRDLVNTTATSTRLESSNQTDLLTQNEEKTSDLLDDVSTIFLESTECSLQGQPRSNNTTSLSSEVSSNSAGNREKSRQRGSQDSLGDYKQNFPFEPPRQAHTRCDGFQMKMSFVQPPVGAKKVATSKVPPWN